MNKKYFSFLIVIMLAVGIPLSTSASEIDPSWWRGNTAPSPSASVVSHVFDGLMTGYDLAIYIGMNA